MCGGDVLEGLEAWVVVGWWIGWRSGIESAEEAGEGSGRRGSTARYKTSGGAAGGVLRLHAEVTEMGPQHARAGLLAQQLRRASGSKNFPICDHSAHARRPDLGQRIIKSAGRRTMMEVSRRRYDDGQRSGASVPLAPNGLLPTPSQRLPVK